MPTTVMVRSSVPARPIAVLVGTRPEIIKMAPVIRAAGAAGLPCTVIHTGQHHSKEMDQVFFDELGLPAPAHRIDHPRSEGPTRHGAQTARILEELERYLMDHRPACLLIEGDTNTVLAGGLACVKLGIPVGHVEAGLRSGDRTMPEEINRVLVDHAADVLYAPTDDAAGNLLGEGIPPERILVTGNTIVDAVEQSLALARERSRIHATLGVRRREYAVLTFHRQENVDAPDRFRSVLEAVAALGITVIYPAHPRSRFMADRHGLERFLEGSGTLRVVEPLGYLDFLLLLADARLVLTDSGGVQEEACILQVPCLTLRDNTERPETVAAGGNEVVGVATAAIREAARRILGDPAREAAMRAAKNPFGDGRAGARIVEDVRRRWLAPAAGGSPPGQRP